MILSQIPPLAPLRSSAAGVSLGSTCQLTLFLPTQANLTWEMASFMARATEPRRFNVPLREVIRRRRVRSQPDLCGLTRSDVIAQLHCQRS